MMTKLNECYCERPLGTEWMTQVSIDHCSYL